MPDYDPALLQPNQEFSGSASPPAKRSGCAKIGIGCFVLLVLVLAFTAGLALLVFKSMTTSDAYKYATEKAKNSPALQRALGTPITVGKLVTGSISVNGPNGKADIEIPLSGPKGKASLYVNATKEAGKWTYQRVSAHVEATNEDIDLLNETPAGKDF